MTHLEVFLARYNIENSLTKGLVEAAWKVRQQLDAELVANHCPSHRNIGELMAKEITETD